MNPAESILELLDSMSEKDIKEYIDKNFNEICEEGKGKKSAVRELMERILEAKTKKH